MVFSSFPVYLGQSNLHQLQGYNSNQQGTGGVENLQTTQPAPPPAQVGGGGGQDTIRPGSMVDRARVARVPLPENGVKCPRCDSTSTKFCYFNNYNLMQQRHFCKTCRRYWTKGGALRNVPVGGGCRRNKRSKSGGSKSEKQSRVADVVCGPTSSGGADITSQSTHHHQLPLMNPAAFQAGGDPYYNGGFQPPQLVATNGNGGFGTGTSFHLGSNSNNNNFLSAEPWRLSAGSLAGFETPLSTNLFPFQSEGKIVEESQGLNGNSTKQFLGSMENSHYWGGGENTWTGGFSGHLNSSSSIS